MKALPVRPIALPVMPEAIPDELLALRQFVGWQYELRDDKWTKVPYYVDAKGKLRRASVTDPGTWHTFDGALSVMQFHGLDGIGFVFSVDDPYVGIDLDHCIAEDGTLTPFAREVLGEFSGAYVEFSPSGTGLHLIACGCLPDRGRKNAAIEMYDQCRFFTLTGHVYPTGSAS